MSPQISPKISKLSERTISKDAWVAVVLQTNTTLNNANLFREANLGHSFSMAVLYVKRCVINCT